MEQSGKRKGGADHRSQGPQTKRSKGGSGNKWQTTSHKEKLENLKESMLQVGDAGIWVTCQRGKEKQARSEMARICEDYGKRLYGIEVPGDEDGDDEVEEDIEASIQKELEGMKPENQPKGKDRPFESVRSGLDCLFFVRTREPVAPIEMVRQICLDAAKPPDANGEKSGSAIGVSRFVNRFTPITVLGRATEKGLDELARTVLSAHFNITKGEGEGEEGGAKEESEGDAPSYAIRPTFRAHNILKRDDVIKKVASLIDDRHKVSLTNPDKVILVDIFQTFCGISVVDGDWESLKRFNIHELKMSAAGLRKDGKPKDEPTDKSAAKGDTNGAATGEPSKA